jgi:hypothetical protein
MLFRAIDFSKQIQHSGRYITAILYYKDYFSRSDPVSMKRFFNRAIPFDLLMEFELTAKDLYNISLDELDRYLLTYSLILEHRLRACSMEKIIGVL